MFIWLCVRWWYSAGWGFAWQRGIVQRLEWCESTFSMTTLVRTWLAPFKQTYTGRVKGSIGEHFRASIDSFISRVIGFIVRSFLLVAGIVCGLLVLITGFFFMIFWAFLPILPFIGVILMVARVGV